MFDGAALPNATVTADFDVRKLDPGHIQPNMGPPNWRGIWFPLGYVKNY